MDPATPHPTPPTDPAPPADAIRPCVPPTAEGGLRDTEAGGDPALGRRAALLAGLTGIAGLALWGTGCVATPPDRRVYVEPSVIYPPGHGPQRPTTAGRPSPAQRVAAPAPAAAPTAVPLSVIPRTAWTSASVASNVNPMNGVTRITVHHAGGKPVWFTAASKTYRMLESIRGGHRSQGWADIGYHFIVDRGGRVIQGRPLIYQGAHVSQNNEHNVGVMVLGNFDKQRPATAQTHALHATLNALASAYRVPVSRVYTHQELRPTACPGKSLQQHMVAARRRSTLG